ncbi:MAG: 4-demethylwyosine synthase TYW1 [archaeon]
MSEEIKNEIKKDLTHKHYGLYGKHSGVEICEWNKKALRGEGVCYKQKFYNVECYRCAQITPAVLWCHQNCIFCWRPAGYMKEHKLDKDFCDKPKDIIEGLFSERKKLLTGFGGLPTVSKKKYLECLIPSHVAISLSGEPTIYPFLPELVKELKLRKEIKTIFIVTNGLEPEMLKQLQDKEALPTQLYLSIVANSKEMQKKINCPKIKDSWKKLNKTINLFSKLKCRRVIRFTLIKGLNDNHENLKEFAALFDKASSDFLEIKSYMYIGESRKNLTIDNMPSFNDCLNYAKEIEKLSKIYKIENSCKPSRIILLKNKNSKIESFIIPKKKTKKTNI